MSTSEPEEEQKCGSIDHVFIQEDQIDRRRRNDRDYRRTKGCNRGRNPEIRKDLQDRAEMTLLAIEEIPYFRLCTYEMDRKETSYSYQTMEYFKETYPQDEFYFIIGADSLFNLETWKCPERLLKTAVILAAYRDDAGAPKEMRRQITYLKEKYACDIRLLRTPVMPVSSSEIRQMIRGGETEDLPIPKKVADYIDLNRLYQVSEHDGNNT
mgnify:CR=1 FL=1